MRIVVVGAGLMGVCSAWYLARRGHSVTVIDRTDGIARLTSFANAGMLTPSMADPWNAPGIFGKLLGWIGREDAPFLLRAAAIPSLMHWGLRFLRNARPERFRVNMERNLRLASYSLNALRALAAELNIEYDALDAGTLKVFRDDAAFADAAARNRVLAELGLDVRMINGAEIVALEPALADVRAQLVGGVYCAADGSGDARRFTEALAQHCVAAGVQFRHGVEVRGFERSGARVDAVITAQGRENADAIVIAAGSWSAPLLARLGVPLWVRPVKGYSVTLDATVWPVFPRRPVIDDALHAATTPLGRRLRVAGTAEFAGDDLTLQPARVANLFELTTALYPSCATLIDRARAEPWCGLRPMSADGVPFIGRSALENVWVNAGQGHLGWTLSAGSGRLLADLIDGRTPEIDAAGYSVTRRD